jgi:ferredoxin/flavodoxin
MVIYYTGTGNSRYVAQCAAALTDDELVNAGRSMQAGERPAFFSEKPWVFCCPTYAWRMPRIFTDFLTRCTFSGNRKAYFLMTCGSEIGCAGDYIQKFCAKKSFEYMGVAAVVMPENYLAMFNVPDGPEALAIIKSGEQTVSEAARLILAGEPFPPAPRRPAGYVSSHVVNPVFFKLFVHDRGFRASDACIGCGECVRGCVQNNITLQNGKPVWNGRCTHCMACICYCPVRAIEYGGRSQKRPQYRCPEYGEV